MSGSGFVVVTSLTGHELVQLIPQTLSPTTNADYYCTVDTLISGGGGGGPFVPTGGGTMSGTLNMTGPRNTTGAWPNTIAINEQILFTGAPTGGFASADRTTKLPLNLFAVQDNVFSNPDIGPDVAAFQVNHVYGDNAAATAGNRIGILNDVALSGLISGNTSSQFVGFYSVHDVFGNVLNFDTGGTASSTNPMGGFFGGDFTMQLAEDVFVYEMSGLEIDMTVVTPSGGHATPVAKYSQGVKIYYSTPPGWTSSTGTEAYLRFDSNHGITYGLVFGDPQGGAFPMNAAGTMIYSLSGSASVGINLSNVTFSSASIMSQGFMVEGTGSVYAESYNPFGSGAQTLHLNAGGDAGINFASSDGTLAVITNQGPGSAVVAYPILLATEAASVALTAGGTTSVNIYIDPPGAGYVAFGGAGLAQVNPGTGVFGGRGFTLANTVSGTINIAAPVNTALGTKTLTAPDVTDTLAVLGTAQTFSAAQVFSTSVSLGVAGSSNGSLIFSNTASGSITIIPPVGALSNPVLTLPDATGTIALLGSTASQTFSGTVTFADGGTWSSLGIAGTSINGSSIGATTRSSVAATTLSASTSLALGRSGTSSGSIVLYNTASGSITIAPPVGALSAQILTLPDFTDTFAVLGHTQTFNATQVFADGGSWSNTGIGFVTAKSATFYAASTASALISPLTVGATWVGNTTSSDGTSPPLLIGLGLTANVNAFVTGGVSGVSLTASDGASLQGGLTGIYSDVNVAGATSNTTSVEYAALRGFSSQFASDGSPAGPSLLGITAVAEQYAASVASSVVAGEFSTALYSGSTVSQRINIYTLLYGGDQAQATGLDAAIGSWAQYAPTSTRGHKVGWNIGNSLKGLFNPISSTGTLIKFDPYTAGSDQTTIGTILDFSGYTTVSSNILITSVMKITGGGHVLSQVFDTTASVAMNIGTASASSITIGSPSTTTQFLGTLKGSTASFTASSTGTVTITNLAPPGAHATIQEWLMITDTAGNVRYIPAF